MLVCYESILAGESSAKKVRGQIAEVKTPAASHVPKTSRRRAPGFRHYASGPAQAELGRGTLVSSNDCDGPGHPEMTRKCLHLWPMYVFGLNP
jgi:hypothetical protein